MPSKMAGSCEAYAGRTHTKGLTAWRPVGRPSLRYKDVCKHDLKNAQINTEYWEGRAVDRDAWRLLTKECVNVADRDRRERIKRKRQEKK